MKPRRGGAAGIAPKREATRAEGAPSAGTTLLDPHGPFALPLLMLLVTRLVLWIMQPFASEDAYITFRYGGELAIGHGLVYNAGERVMGFTSLPWTLWCGLGIALHVDPVGWTRATSLACDVATLIVGGRMLLAAFGPAAAWAFTAFFGVWPLFAASAISGMETSAFFSVLVLAAWLTSQRSVWGGVALGLAAIFRPEGMAAALVLALGADRRARLIALGIVALAVAFLTVYFGSPVPQSLAAKAALYGTPGPWNGRLWWEWVLPFPLFRYPAASEGVQVLPVAALVFAAAACGATELWRQRTSAAARATGACLAIWIGYAAFGVAYFWWYMVVPMGGLVILAAVGLPRLARGAWIWVAGALFLIGTWTVAPSLYIGRAQVEHRNFATVADFLFDRVGPNQSVFLEPIGLIGFRNPLRVIDEVGLVSPAVAQRRLRGAGWYADVVAEQRPDWIVVRHDQMAKGQAFAGRGNPFRTMAERDSLLSRYRLVLTAVQESDLEVYRRER